MKTTPEKQVIKSMLSILDATTTDGEPVSDALQKLSFLHAELIRDICKKYGVELNEPLPFQSTIQIGYASAKTLCEEIKHNAVNDGITTNNETPAEYSLLSGEQLERYKGK